MTDMTKLTLHCQLQIFPNIKDTFPATYEKIALLAVAIKASNLTLHSHFSSHLNDFN